ncbi:hypothetical protein DY000_02057058 [Brassica cretica]|uniref:Cycloeucalenol cycloisomerase n=1 Tax=Brassica cretica TaxID=69181 RepID=A0ABQ7AKR8_BRACR|nr:hypothetical protein DY000_02057058 [Brassica cretica]
MSGPSDVSRSLWLAQNPSKRWGELFFLFYTPFWLTLSLGVIVPYKLYETFTELEYLLAALVSAVPAFLIPMLVIGKVPHSTFFMAHVCFLFYHVASNITLRRLRHSISDLPDSLRWCFEAAWILAFSYFIAYLETVSIVNFPYYEFVDRNAMYRVGCLFYALYFIVSFPMFFRMDEKSSDKWNLSRVAIDALGASMLVERWLFRPIWGLKDKPAREIPFALYGIGK